MGGSRTIHRTAKAVASVRPDLTFTIEGAEAMRYAASPHIAFKLRIVNASPQAIHSVLLRCQVQIEAARRQYTPDSQRRLADLFGEPGQWPQTVRGILWTNVNCVVPAFAGEVAIDLAVPCTFDFNIAATKYFAGLEDGDVPLTLFFNGTIFYADETSTLRVNHIPWEKEASYRMPLHVWRGMMDLYYPNVAWLCLRRDAFDRLNGFKIQNGIPTFEEVVQAVIP